MRWSTSAAFAAAVIPVAGVASAHVRYSTDDPSSPAAILPFVASVLAEPVNAALFGLATLAAAATGFLTLTLTLFGLPDDPVLAHVTLFGLTSMLFVTGAGPRSIDWWLAARREPSLERSVPV